MDMVSNFTAVALVSLLAAISPGPDFFIVVKNSLSHSRKAGFLTAIGIATALVIHLTYTFLGIALLIQEGSFVYHLLKYAGAGYLFYIGAKGFISSFKKQANLELCYAGNSTLLTTSTAFKQGFLTNLLNPKCALFFVSLFSQFITPDTTTAIKFGYAIINWSLSLIWFLFLAYLLTGKLLMDRIGKFRTSIDRIMGALLMILSLKLIFS